MSDLKERLPFCSHGSKESISLDLIKFLTKLEYSLDLELEYNSGFRCPVCNRLSQGVPNSAHLRGFAVDIKCPEGSIRYKLIKELFRQGTKRIGIGKNFIHVDIDSSLPQNVIWIYS
jgi:uncharacterized protein YcbK (DUF882 family)